jgi:hypothetical protein
LSFSDEFGHNRNPLKEHILPKAIRINELITGLGGDAICDDCIFEALSLSSRQQANQATVPLATTSDFHRDGGVCIRCGAEKLVIQKIQ